MDKGQLIALLKHEGFHERIVSAFEKVNREDFVLDNFKKLAYENISLPISHDQTMSQPSTIAISLSLLKLKENHKVLEVGSGCGYTLALMSEVVGENGIVYGVEIVTDLAYDSLNNLTNYKNVNVYNQNGKVKIPEAPSFDRILVSAAVPEVPREILEQLKDDGIVVAPIGSRDIQTLTSIRRNGDEFVVEKELPGFIFVHFVD